MVQRIHHRTKAIAQQLATPGVSVRTLSASQWRELALVAGPALLLLLAAFWLASRFIEPAPPKVISITTGGPQGAYFQFGQRYRDALARTGITLNVRESAGSIENVARLKDPDSAIDVALLQGGIADQKSLPGVISLGRLFIEPLWLFYRGSDVVTRLTQLKDKRIVVGPGGSGTNTLAVALLSASGITDKNASLLSFGTADAVAAVESGSVDAIFLTQAPESQAVQKLLRNEDLRLVNFEHAEAYTRLFPYLTRIVLPQGAIDLSKNIPERDTALVAPIATLVARETLHPALVGLLVEAAKEIHNRGGLFTRIGEFPKPVDSEFEMSSDALRVYNFGPPFLQRYLPFWLATFIERMKIMLLPLATILLPLVKIIPAVYKWRIRRRIHYWYSRIRSLEQASVSRSMSTEAQQSELERIQTAVAAIPIPPSFNEQYYTLRSALELVDNRIRATV